MCNSCVVLSFMIFYSWEGVELLCVLMGRTASEQIVEKRWYLLTCAVVHSVTEPVGYGWTLLVHMRIVDFTPETAGHVDTERGEGCGSITKHMCGGSGPFSWEEQEFLNYLKTHIEFIKASYEKTSPNSSLLSSGNRDIVTWKSYNQPPEIKTK